MLSLNLLSSSAPCRTDRSWQEALNLSNNKALLEGPDQVASNAIARTCCWETLLFETAKVSRCLTKPVERKLYRGRVGKYKGRANVGRGKRIWKTLEQEGIGRWNDCAWNSLKRGRKKNWIWWRLWKQGKIEHCLFYNSCNPILILCGLCGCKYAWVGICCAAQN